MAQNILFPSAAGLLGNEENNGNRGLGSSDICIDAASNFVSFPVSASEATYKVDSDEEDNSGLPLDSPVNVAECMPSLSNSDGDFENASLVRKERKKLSNSRSKRKQVDNSSENSDNECSSWESGDSQISQGKREDTRNHEKKKRKKKKKKKKKKRERQRSPYLVHPAKPATIWLSETQLDHANAFREDRHPDQINFEFGSLYNNDIASFRPAINCQCLGSDKRRPMILYRKKKERKRSTRRFTRYFSTEKIVDVNVVEEGDERIFTNNLESENFLPLNCWKNNESIKDPFVPADACDDDASWRKCNKEFSKQLMEQPHDVDTWLAYVRHQNAFTVDEDEEEHYYLSSLAKPIIEKKISILEKALESNPMSVKLIIEHMNLVREIWTHDRVIKQWKDTMFRIPNRGILWRHYLLYLQSNIMTMKVSSITNSYRRAFRFLIGILNRTVVSHPAEDNAEEEVFLVFLQMVLFFWQGGHSERATCLLQCLVEFNHYPPRKLVLNETHETRIQKFEVFVQSDAPRFGVSGAQGWNGSIDVKDTPDPSSFPVYSSSRPIDFMEKLRNHRAEKSTRELWLMLENVRNTSEFLPYQGDTDNCDDTERIILADDVLFSLFSIKSPSLNLQTVFVYLFLLGVPIPRFYLNSNVLNAFSTHYIVRQPEGRCLCHHTIFNQFVAVNSVLFGESERPNYDVIVTVRNILAQSLSSTRNELFARQLSEIWLHFESVLLRYEFENAEEFDRKCFARMKKFIKKLLKMSWNRSNVTLWCMLATFEWNIGNYTEGERIFTTAIHMTSVEGNGNVMNRARIIKSQIDLCLNWHALGTIPSISDETKRKIMTLCISFVDPEKSNEGRANPVSLLRVFKTLQEVFDTILNDSNGRDQESTRDFLWCFVLFVYLYRGLSSLVETLDKLAQMSASDSVVTLDLPDVFARTLVLLKSESRVSGETFRSYKHFLRTWYHSYPNNDILGTLFHTEHTDGLSTLTTRRLYQALLLSDDDDDKYTVQPWLHWIRYEENRMKATTAVFSGNLEMTSNNNDQCIENKNSQVVLVASRTGMVNRIRRLYKAMLQRPSARLNCCVELWMLYVEFELDNGTQKEILNVVNEGLRWCSGAKNFYMFLIQRFEERFDEMLHLMEEKEVRVKLVAEELDILVQD